MKNLTGHVDIEEYLKSQYEKVCTNNYDRSSVAMEVEAVK